MSILLYELKFIRFAFKLKLILQTVWTFCQAIVIGTFVSIASFHISINIYKWGIQFSELTNWIGLRFLIVNIMPR